VLSPI